MRTVTAGLLTLAGLAGSAAPAAAAVRTAGMNTPFTVSWAEYDGEPRSITATVTGFRCGKDTNADVATGKRAATELFGDFADPQPTVESGYQLCTAHLTLVNSGKKKVQHNPGVTAVDASGVEFSEDEAFTKWVGTGVTKFSNREYYYGDAVDFNPRQMCRSAVAFLIPAGTKVTKLRYAGEASPMVDSAQTTVTVA